MRKGDKVLIDVQSYSEDKPKLVPGIPKNHPGNLDTLERYNANKSRAESRQVATVTGTYDYGSYINCIFDDGFEFGMEKKHLRKIPKS